jgi:protein-S-isoprenylcysteine O-methyltransferase Ste14
MNQTFFHILFTASFLVFTFIRMYFRRQAETKGGKAEYIEGKLHRALRLGFGVPFILSLFVYMVYPRFLDWAAIPLPVWAQWLGAALTLASLPLILWIQVALGLNFDTTLHVRKEHTLVTHGPYRWVRHPMYSVFFMQSIGFLLLTRNLYIGGIYLIGLTLVVLTRIHNEEATMLGRFGDAYRSYMRRTGRFLPRF